MTTPRVLSRPLSLVSRLAARVARSGGALRDRGASAIEFAIIAAVVVVAASVVGGVVYNIVSSKSSQLDQCAKQAVGATSCGVGAPASP